MKKVVKFKKDDLPVKIFEDLERFSIEEVARIYKNYFANNINLAYSLADHFEKESQVYAVQTVLEQTKFAEVVNFELQAFEGVLQGIDKEEFTE